MGFQMENSNSLRPKNASQVMDKVKSILIIFFDIKGLFTKNSSLQVKHPNTHTPVTFYSNCMKVREDFVPNFGKTELVDASSHTSFFTREFVTKNNMNVVPHPPFLPDLAPCDFSVSPI
jgi:hypothetical protein